MNIDRKVQHTCPGGITCRMCRAPRKDRVKIVRQGKRKMKQLLRRELEETKR